jgi:hypothetical protein
VICFNADSEFYRMPHRGGELKAFAEQLISMLKGPVFTHNAWGEYGSLDHILIHQIARASGLEVWSSDIAIEIDWLPIRQWLVGSERAAITPELFNELKSIYAARGCWTWSFEEPKECGIHQIC